MRDDLIRILPIIERLDRPTPQILIKANIVETTKEIARDLGIRWGGMYGTGGNPGLYITPGGTGGTTTSSPTSGSYTPTATGPTGIAGQGFGVNFPAANLAAAASGSLGLIFGTIGGNLLEIQLQALQKDSKLNILSSPSITTLDNQKAFTENGERVPYVTAQTSSGTTTFTTVFVDVVMRLEITPHVIDGKNLKMTIFVQKDDVDISRKDSLGDPYIIKKQTQTILIVKDGETIVISGLTKKTRSDSDTGWPGLKEVPVLGWLFKADSKNDKMEEVLIFITPHILQLGKIDKNAEPVESDVTQQNENMPKQENSGTTPESKKDLEPKQ
jgi:type IV pilus assembly protein PilQ